MTDTNPYTSPNTISQQTKAVSQWPSVLLCLALAIGTEAALIFILPIIKVQAFSILALAYPVVLLLTSFKILKARDSLSAITGGLVCASVLLGTLVNWVIVKAISHIG